MPFNSSSVESLRRVFRQGFVIHDIAEPLASFDDSTTAEQVRAFMESRRFEVVGVRRGGVVAGYLDLADLGQGVCGDHFRPFEEGQVVPDTTPLAELTPRLKDRPRLFVSVLG